MIAEDIKWETRESNVFSIDFLDTAIFYTLPRCGTWNICNKIIFKNKEYKLYMRLIHGESQPRIYTKEGDYGFINDVWNEIRSAIIDGTTSKYLRN